MKKALRYFKVVYVIILVAMFTAWIVRYSMLGGNKLSPGIETAVVKFAEFPSKVIHLFKRENDADKRYIADTQTKTGFNYFADTSQLSPGYLLISTFEKNKDLEFELLDIRKNVLLKKWTVDPDSILNRTKTTR